MSPFVFQIRQKKIAIYLLEIVRTNQNKQFCTAYISVLGRHPVVIATIILKRWLSYSWLTFI